MNNLELRDDSNTNDTICKLCKNRYAKYTCPKCNIPYCSVDCYKSIEHEQCSETFYRDLVMLEMQANANQNQPGTSQSAAQMCEILTRLHHDEQQLGEDSTEHNEDLASSSDSDDESGDLAARMDGIDLDNATLVWDNLTNGERQEFATLIKTNAVMNMIPEWRPWWKIKQPLVQEYNDEDEFKSMSPHILDQIEDISELALRAAADCVKFNIVNVIASYLFAVRYYNGDHWDFLKEARSIVIHVSVNLNMGNNLQSFDEALTSVTQQAFTYDFLMINDENVNWLKDDLEDVLSGPSESYKNYYILSALSDLYRMLTSPIRNAQSDNMSSDFFKRFNAHFHMPDVVSKKLKLTTKKIMFYIAYVKRFGLLK